MTKPVLAVLVAAIAAVVLVPVASAAPSSHILVDKTIKKLPNPDPAASAAPSSHPAFNKTVWHLPDLDPVVSEVAGTSLRVDYADNQAEWDYIAGGSGVLGFTCIVCGPYDTVYDPYAAGSYNLYRTVWFSPEVRNILVNPNSYSYKDLGMAFLTVDHEAMHWRLFSGDENRVNACAFKDMPRFLTVDFRIPATTTQTVSVPEQYQVRVRYRAKVHGRFVWRYRYVWRTRYVDQQQTITNPLITNIVGGAAQFMREDQDSSYNSGVCY